MKGSPQDPTNDREGKEAERPWTMQRLNSYTSLERTGAQHIGSEFEIVYFPNNDEEKKTIQGIVVYSSQTETIIQDCKSGGLISVNTNRDHCCPKKL